MWFYDAVSQSDGTVGGCAKVLADSIRKLPKEQQPWWVKHQTHEELRQVLVSAIQDAYTSCVSVHDYLEKQYEKGRGLEDAYEDVRAIVNKTSRAPLFPKPPGGEEAEAEAAKDFLKQEVTNSGEAADEAFNELGRGLPYGEALAVKASLKRSNAPHRHLKREDPSVSHLLPGDGHRRRAEDVVADVGKAPFEALAGASSTHEAHFTMAQATKKQWSGKHKEPQRAPHAAAETAAPAAEVLPAAIAAASAATAAPAAAAAAAVPVPAAAPAPTARGLSEEELREPLMLLGTPNGWDLEEARKHYRMSFHSSRKPVPNRQESRLRLEVPPDGVAFRIVSADRPQSFFLYPGRGTRELQDGKRGHVAVRLELEHREGDTAKLPSFVIDGAGETGEVDVRVCLNTDSPPEVWFNEL